VPAATWLTSSSPRWVWLRAAVVALVVAAGLAPGLFSLPPIDRDESRFAQASRQMAAGEWSDWVVPRVGERVRLNKPPLIYWLQAGSARASGDAATLGGALAVNGPGGAEMSAAERARAVRLGGIGWYRMPSALMAVAAALLTFVLGRELFVRPWLASGRDGEEASEAEGLTSGDRRRLGELAATLGALLLGCCVMVLWDGRQARADQLLLATTTAAVWALLRCVREAHPESLSGDGSAMWRSNAAAPEAASAVGGEGARRVRVRSAGLLWVFVALGVLAKGPITLLVVGGAAIGLGALSGRWAWMLRLRWWLGALVLAAMVGGWVAMVAWDVGFGAYWSIVYDEVVVRSKEAAEGHWGPPGYHLAVLPAMFWPGSLLLFGMVGWLWSGCGAAGMNGRVRRWRERLRGRGFAAAFLVGWIVPSWVVFEAVTTKLPHYTLPLYPALALLCGWFAASCTFRAARYAQRRMDRVLVTVAVTLGAAPAVGGVWLLWWSGVGVNATVMVGVAAVAVCGGATVWLLLRGRAWLGGAASVGLTLVSAAVLLGEGVPRASGVWISPGVAEALVEAGAQPGERVAAVGYAEDSLVFLTDAATERIGYADLPAWSEANAGRLAVFRLPARWDEELPSAVEDVDPLGEVRGYHYNGGGWQRVWVLRAEDASRLAEAWLIERAAAASERDASGG